jgi:hypothetical protein
MVCWEAELEPAATRDGGFLVEGCLAFFNSDMPRLGAVDFFELLAWAGFAGTWVFWVLEESLDFTLLIEEPAELWSELRSSRSLRSRCCATVSLAGSSHETSNILEDVGPLMKAKQMNTVREEI